MKSTKPKRDRKKTEERLLSAVGEILERDGVGALGVNAIAKQAQVNKVLIYRYFDDLPGLYRAYGEQSDIWPTFDELLGEFAESWAEKDLLFLMQQFFRQYYYALERRPQTIDLLAWECVSRNELIVMLEELREEGFHHNVSQFQQAGFTMTKELNQLIVLIVGAIHYFLIRRRNITIFAGIDIGSDDGWQELFTQIDSLLESHL